MGKIARNEIIQYNNSKVAASRFVRSIDLKTDDLRMHKSEYFIYPGGNWGL